VQDPAQVAQLFFDFRWIIYGLGYFFPEELATALSDAVGRNAHRAWIHFQGSGHCFVTAVRLFVEKRGTKLAEKFSSFAVRELIFEPAEDIGQKCQSPAAFEDLLRRELVHRFQAIPFLGLERIQGDRNLATAAFGGLLMVGEIRQVILKRGQKK
jgi:hypothetical protein